MSFLTIALRVVEKEGCVPIAQLVYQQLRMLRPVSVCMGAGQTTVLSYMPGTSGAELGCADEEYGGKHL